VLAGIVAAVILNAEPGVALDVPLDVPCQLAWTLAAALSEQHVRATPAIWRLKVVAVPGGLEVALFDASRGLRGQRALQVHDEDCPVIPRAIATLVRSWIDQALEAEAPTIPPEALPSPRAMSNPPLLGADEALEEAQVDDDAPRSRARPLTADGVELARLPELGEPQAVPQLEDEDLDKQDELERKDPDELPRVTASLQLLGGGAFVPSYSGVAQGALGAELGFYEPFGVQLEGGIESPISVNMGMDTVTAQVTRVGVSLRAAVYGTGRSGLFVCLGGNVERILVSVQGVDNDSRVILGGGAVFSAEWRQVLKSGLYLAARAHAELRAHVGTFSTAFTPDALVTSPFSAPFVLGFGVGLGWNFL
jgi:hypothetical protein